MANGILIIDKPAGWTSMDVCAKLRGIFHEKRVGHGGTLDPMATGVLPVFVGRATRAVEFADKSDKEYIAGLKLGVITNTQDTSGEVLAQNPVSSSRESLENTIQRSFLGEIDQIPPMYSAIKINGKKLYELARKGKDVERPPRRVVIRELEILDAFDPAHPFPSAPGTHFLLRVYCSKGTYIRTLCHDIGAQEQCGGCMSYLRRTMAAGFTLDNAVTLEQVQSADDPASLLMPVDTLFSDREKLILTPNIEKKIRNGMTVLLPSLTPGEFRVYGQNGEFLALCRAADGKLSTIKSFF